MLQEKDHTTSSQEELSPVFRDGKWGIIDKSGITLVPFKYNGITILETGIIKVRIGDMFGFINNKGKELAPIIYTGTGKQFNDGLIAIERNYKWGYLNSEGEEVIPPIYDVANAFNEGLAAVANGSRKWKWGFVDLSANEVIPLIYSDALRYTQGVAAVKLLGKWGFIDKNNKEVIPFVYDEVNTEIIGFINDKVGKDLTGLMAKVRKGKFWGFIDKLGREVIPVIYDRISLFHSQDGDDPIAEAEKNGKLGLIDITGKEKIPFEYDYIGFISEGLLPVKKEGKWGYLNKAGEVVIPLIYDSVSTNDPKCSIQFVEKDCKWGFFTNGKEIISPIYDKHYNFNLGLAMVERNGKQGYIDETGKEVIPLIYNKAYTFDDDGFARVLKDDKVLIIDTSGKIVKSFEKEEYINKFKESVWGVIIKRKATLFGKEDKDDESIRKWLGL